MKPEVWKSLALTMNGGEYRYLVEGEPLLPIEETTLLARMAEAVREAGGLDYDVEMDVRVWVVRNGRAGERSLRCVYVQAGSFDIEAIKGFRPPACFLHFTPVGRQ